jgi:hypothetical protein
MSLFTFSLFLLGLQESGSQRLGVGPYRFAIYVVVSYEFCKMVLWSISHCTILFDVCCRQSDAFFLLTARKLVSSWGMLWCFFFCVYACSHFDSLASLYYSLLLSFLSPYIFVCCLPTVQALAVLIRDFLTYLFFLLLYGSFE